MSGVNRFVKPSSKQAPPPHNSFSSLDAQGKAQPSPAYASSFQRPSKPPRISAPPRPLHEPRVNTRAEAAAERARSNSADFFREPTSPVQFQSNSGGQAPHGSLSNIALSTSVPTVSSGAPFMTAGSAFGVSPPPRGGAPSPVSTSNKPMSPTSRRWPHTTNGSNVSNPAPGPPVRQGSRRTIRQVPKKVLTHTFPMSTPTRSPLQGGAPSTHGRKTMPGPTRKPTMNKPAKPTPLPSSRPHGNQHVPLTIPGPPPLGALSPKLSLGAKQLSDSSISTRAPAASPTNRDPNSSALPAFSAQSPRPGHHTQPHMHHRKGASYAVAQTRSKKNTTHAKSPSLSASSTGSSSSTGSNGAGNVASFNSQFGNAPGGNSHHHKSSHANYSMLAAAQGDGKPASLNSPPHAGRRFCPRWDCRIRIVSQTARYCEQCGTVLDSPPVERGAPPVDRAASKTSGMKDLLKATLAQGSGSNLSAPVTMQRDPKPDGPAAGGKKSHPVRGSVAGALQRRVSLENFLNEELEDDNEEQALSFDERLWDNVAGVIEHNKSVSRETTKHLVKYFKELAEIENSYGKALWKHALTAEIQELKTLKAGWDAFRKVQYDTGVKHCHRASEMGKQTVAKLSTLLDHLTETHTNLVETMRTSDKRLEGVSQTYEKSKSKYRQAHEKEQQLVQKLEVLQSKGQIPVAKLNKQRERLKQAADETREANEGQNVAENAVFAMTSSNQQTTSTVLKSYEKLEFERVNSLMTILQADFRLKFDHRADEMRILEDCRRKIVNMNVHQDVLAYVKSVETGKKCPYDSTALVSNTSGVSAPVLTSRSDVGAHRENLGKGGLANKSTCYEVLEDGNIRFFAKTNVGAAIVMTLDFKEQSIQFCDTSGVLKKEIFASDVIQVLVQVDRKTRVVAQVPTMVQFQQFNDQYTVTMQADADIRLFLCDQLRRLEKRLKIEGADVDPEVVRFNVNRAGKLEVLGGPKKSDVVLLDARYCTMKFAKSGTDVDVSNITRAEKSMTNNRFLSLQLQNHEDLTLQFENAEQRKQFLGALWRIRKKLSLSDVEMKESAASPDNELHVWVGSWNLGECSYFFEDAEQAVMREPRNLSEWIVGGQDIYVIGFQECPSKKREDWIKGVLAQICATSQSAGINDRYHLLAERHMLEIVCFVVVREPLLASISTVESAQVATGIGGVIGNKGAVGITLTINDTSLCFVLVHFAARAERLEQRKNNFHEITRDLALGLKDEDLLEQFDHLFWFGDLNYRVEMEFNHVVNLVEQCQFDQLWATDQLQREITAGNVFNEFQEGALNFAPTYRMQKDRHGFSNKRAQPPSYTDRVLWKSLPHARDLTHVSMNGCRNTFGSDHRPIFALYNLQPRIPQFQSWKQRLQDDSRYEITLSSVRVSASSSTMSSSARSTTAPPTNSALCLCVQHPCSENIVLSEDVLFARHSSCWEWADSQISPMRLFINDINYLSGTHMFIQLKVSDSNRYDAFGFCVVSLANVFSKTPTTFERPISRHGHILGKLTGRIQGSRRF